MTSVGVEAFQDNAEGREALRSLGLESYFLWLGVQQARSMANSPNDVIELPERLKNVEAKLLAVQDTLATMMESWWGIAKLAQQAGKKAFPLNQKSRRVPARDYVEAGVASTLVREVAQKILDEMEPGVYYRRSDFIENLPGSLGTYSRAMQSLVQTGLVQRIGEKVRTRYRLDPRLCLSQDSEQ